MQIQDSAATTIDKDTVLRSLGTPKFLDTKEPLEYVDALKRTTTGEFEHLGKLYIVLPVEKEFDLGL